MLKQNLSWGRFPERFREFLDRELVKLFLSLLIILSVLPFAWTTKLWALFFGIFVVELAMRFFILSDDLRNRTLSKADAVFFVLDIVATLSFLPIEAIFEDARFLRLFRLTRMVLLLHYWEPVVREIWVILSKKERRYQLGFVAISALILSFISAVLMDHFHGAAIDLNGDGDPTNDRSFWTFLWWSFRQIQDPGNLLGDPQGSMAFFFSVFLTIAGMFIFSFLIGIGTSIVEELVSVSKERRLGMREHSVLCNITERSRVLLEELATYYAKSFRPPSITAMGERPTRHGYMTEGFLRRIRYRQGRPLSRHDLERVDADRARRVILLGNPESSSSDSEIVSQILSVREVNRQCWIHAELKRFDNVRAAIAAGGEKTVPVLADRLIGMYLANVLVFPGVQRIYDQLLTSKGAEIYTYVYNRAGKGGGVVPQIDKASFGQLLVRCHEKHGVILLGDMVEDAGRIEGFSTRLLGGREDGGDAQIVGYFGVADNFEHLKKAVLHLDKLQGKLAEVSSQSTSPSLGLCPVTNRFQSILIFGFHEGIVGFCEQLLRYSGELSITIVVSDTKRLHGARRAFVERETSDVPGFAPKTKVSFSAADDHTIHYSIDGNQAQGGRCVTLMEGDWSDERDLMALPGRGVTLSAVDGILFTYAADEHDPDARTALGLLKLMDLKERLGDLFRADLRILCEVVSVEKAVLLRRRFERSHSAGGSVCSPVTVVAAEYLLNALVAQSVFVPGITQIYDELLNNTKRELCRVVVESLGDRALKNFGELLDVVYRETGLVAVGVEVEEGDKRDLFVNPRPGTGEYGFERKRPVAVFAIGDPQAVPRATDYCEGCFAGRPPAN